MSNQLFPTFSGQSWPVKRTPRFNTKVKSAISGRESRAAFMAYPLYDIELTFEYLSLTDYQTLGGFFKSRKGKFDSFLFTDADENSVTAQFCGAGDGSNKVFQLVRTTGGFTEPCENINGSPSIYLNGVLQASGYTIGSTGVLTFTAAPAGGVAITWTGSYYWRVRFNQDTAEFVQNMKTFFDMKKLSFVGATGNKV
jgi:uncharacterized protein (TIGR02217 family)